VPVVSGLAAGHEASNRALPFGVPATLDAEAGTLVFDPCVLDRGGEEPQGRRAPRRPRQP